MVLGSPIIAIGGEKRPIGEEKNFRERWIGSSELGWDGLLAMKDLIKIKYVLFNPRLAMHHESIV